MIEHHSFTTVDLTTVHNSVVFLDLDGTASPHGKDIPQEIQGNIEKLLSQHNAVYLASNNRDRARVARIAAELGIPVYESSRKPDTTGVSELVSATGKKNIVVIGDKLLTDGIFAWRLNATFIKVESLRHSTDPLYVRLHYWLDQIAAALLKVAQNARR